MNVVCLAWVDILSVLAYERQGDDWRLIASDVAMVSTTCRRSGLPLQASPCSHIVGGLTGKANNDILSRWKTTDH